MYTSTYRALPLGVIYLASQIVAQQVIQVQVGDNGQFYNPSNFTAPKGSIINFQYVGTAHSVVQGNFSTPCQPLQGGFDSGIAGLQTSSGSSLTHPVIWNLTITDDSSPIWFYCKAESPQPHCQNGMVGVINLDPQSGQTLEAFRNASMNAPLSTQRTGTILKGLGASASATPALPSIPTKPNTGAIVGGIFGGLAGIVVVIGLVYLLLQSKRKARRLEAERLAIDGPSWMTRPAMDEGWHA